MGGPTPPQVSSFQRCFRYELKNRCRFSWRKGITSAWEAAVGSGMVEYGMIKRLSLLGFCLCLALLVLPGGYGSWTDDLTVEIGVSTGSWELDASEGLTSAGPAETDGSSVVGRGESLSGAGEVPRLGGDQPGDGVPGGSQDSSAGAGDSGVTAPSGSDSRAGGDQSGDGTSGGSQDSSAGAGDSGVTAPSGSDSRAGGNQSGDGTSGGSQSSSNGGSDSGGTIASGSDSGSGGSTSDSSSGSSGDSDGSVGGSAAD